MNKICTFAGHGKIYYGQNVYKKIINFAEMLIIEKDISEFWVGNYGAFDVMAARAVRDLKAKYPHIILCLVIPYITSQIHEYREEYKAKFSEIIMADIPYGTPRYAYIIECNRYMVDNSEALICYVEHESGGAAKTLDYARRKGNIEIFNIANNF